MNANVLTFVTQILQLAPLAIQVGQSLTALAEQSATALSRDGGPTQADFDTLAAYEASLRAPIDATIAAEA